MNASPVESIRGSGGNRPCGSGPGQRHGQTCPSTSPPPASRSAGPPAPSTFPGLLRFRLLGGAWLLVADPWPPVPRSRIHARPGAGTPASKSAAPTPSTEGPSWGTHPECSDMRWKSLPTLYQAKGPRGGGAAVCRLRSAPRGPKNRVSFREGQRQCGRKSAPSSSQAPRPGPPHQTCSLVMISLRGCSPGGLTACQTC